jgi:3,4-dihydroxy 2-butanone 4-phosphate synthase/GTP cyclohydrolase II
MHAISIFDDLLGRPGSRKRTLQRSMAAIGEEGSGLIVVLMPRSPDALQQEVAGKPEGELREYGIGAQILAELGVHDMILLTNSPRNVVGIEGYHLRVVDERPIPAA